MFPSLREDPDIYELACEYMAATELFERSVFHRREKGDTTCAQLIPPGDRYAWDYARFCQKQLGIFWPDVRQEIKRHREYTAQMWIDEYERLKCVE